MIIIPIDVDGVNLHIPLTQRVLPGGNLLNNGGIGLKFNLIRGWSDFDSLQANFYWSADTTILSPKDDMPFSPVQLDENNVAKIPSDLLDMQSGVLFVSITSKSGDTCGSSLFGRFDIYNSVNNSSFSTGEFYSDQDYSSSNPATIEHNLGRVPTYFFMFVVSGFVLPPPEQLGYNMISIHITNSGGSLISPPSEDSKISRHFGRLNSSGLFSNDTDLIGEDEINDKIVTIDTKASNYLINSGSLWKWFAY